MSTALQQYTNYRDAGVEWLGEIPAHWHITSIGSVSQLVQTGPFGSQLHASDYVENGVPVINPSHLRDGRIIPAASVAVSNETADRLARHQLRTGDVIAARRGELGRCAVVASTENGWLCGTGSLIIRPRFDLIVPAFLQLVLSSQGVSDALGFASVGSTMNNLSAGLVARQRIPVPSVLEQKAIVRFLAHAHQQINRLIRNKRRLIALLNEEKQAIIQQAVTRGLDPDVAMKASGVEWLGEVPAHWEIGKLGRSLNSIEQGWSPVAAEGELAEDQWSVLTLAAIKRGVFDANAIKPIAEMATGPSILELNELDVLLTRSNTRDRVGDTCLVKNVRPRTIFSDLIYRLSPNADSIDRGFLVYQLLSRVGRIQIEQDARGSSDSMPKISQRHIKSWRMLRPPLKEQLDIANWLDRRLHTIDVAISRTNREIDLIREYRTRLIADVATGQLDVRGAAAALPDIEDGEVESAFGAADGFGEGDEVSDDEIDAIEDADAAD